MASNVLRIAVADRGMNMSQSPLQAGGSRTATRVVNFLTGQDRRLPIRGPVWERTGTTYYTTTLPAVVYNEGRQRVWYQSAAAGAVVIERTGVLVGSQTGLTASTLFSPGRRTTWLRGLTYGFAPNPATLPTPWATRGYGTTVYANGVTWDGTTTNPVAMNFSPVGALDYATHLDRIFALGGAPPGGLVATWDESLYWTDVGGVSANTLAEWQDDATGLTNVIKLGNEGGNLVGFGHVNRALVIFRSYGIQVLSGETPAAFQLRTVIRNTGCIGVHAICDYDDACIFMDRRGHVQFFDGNSLTELSGPINPILERMASRLVPTTFNTGIPGNWLPYVNIVRVGPSHILVNIGEPGYPNGENHSFLCHVATGTWSRFTTHNDIFGDTFNNVPVMVWPMGPDVLAYAGNTGGTNDKRFFYLNDIVNPWGTSVYDQAVSRALGTGRDYTGAAYRYIPAVMESHVSMVGGPQLSGKVLRVGMDYTNRCLSSESPSSGGLDVIIGQRTENNGIISTGLNTGYETPPGSTNYDTPVSDAPLRFAMWDVNAESRDVKVQVSTPTGAAPSTDEVKYIDLGDIYVEWQPTNPRGNPPRQ